MYVIKGNTAIFKCIVPSFVADYVSIVSWEDTVGNRYSVSPNEHFGIKVYYCKFSVLRDERTSFIVCPIFVIFDVL